VVRVPLQGVEYGLSRWGRVLVADEMGVGKTVQALALAACYQVGVRVQGSKGWLFQEQHSTKLCWNAATCAPRRMSGRC
jgi:hypothetical protein